MGVMIVLFITLLFLFMAGATIFYIIRELTTKKTGVYYFATLILSTAFAIFNSLAFLESSPHAKAQSPLLLIVIVFAFIPLWVIYFLVQLNFKIRDKNSFFGILWVVKKTKLLRYSFAVTTLIISASMLYFMYFEFKFFQPNKIYDLKITRTLLERYELAVEKRI